MIAANEKATDTFWASLRKQVLEPFTAEDVEVYVNPDDMEYLFAVAPIGGSLGKSGFLYKYGVQLPQEMWLYGKRLVLRSAEWAESGVAYAFSASSKEALRFLFTKD